MIELMISDCIDCRAKMQQPPVESSFLAALFPFQDSGRSMNEMTSEKWGKKKSLNLSEEGFWKETLIVIQYYHVLLLCGW